MKLLFIISDNGCDIICFISCIMFPGILSTPYDVFLQTFVIIDETSSADVGCRKNYLGSSVLDRNSEEIERFFGIIIWMGLFQLPSIQAYCRKSFIVL